MHVVIFNLALLTACGFALVRGAAPERLVALMLLLAALAGMVSSYLRHQYTHVEVSLLVIDFALLVGLVAIALRANRFWPIWLTSLHTVAVTVHGVRAYLPELPGWTYSRAVSLIAYPMLLILLIGAQRHHVRTKVRGGEPSWSPLA